jgi:hypothetical protein
MKKLPTDLKILNAVYERYYDEFASYTDGGDSRNAKIYVPIDIKQLAEDLNVDGDIIFGRLYYHLDKKYGYRQEDDSRVPFFGLRVGKDKNCVNFPLMASVLADLRDRARRNRTATWIASGSLIISVIAIVISILGVGRQ